jgi:hypothetical protein
MRWMGKATRAVLSFACIQRASARGSHDLMSF